jgi:TPR repeat protein
MYVGGRGVKKNEAEGLRLARLAAQAGDGYGEAILGMIYADGLGVPKDPNEAVRHLRVAADKGNATGLAGLGWMYEYGKGVARDEVEAIRLYRASANQSNAWGLIRLGRMYKEGKGGVAKDDAQAVRFFRMAVDVGSASAQAALAWMYNYGRGVARDQNEALRLYRSAAEQGDAFGMNGTAWVLATMGRNLDEAVKWAEKALALESDNSGHLDTMAFVYYRRGQPERALTFVQRAVSTCRDCETEERDLLAGMEAQYGDILAALGRGAEARPHWQRALKLSEGRAVDTWDRAAVQRKLGGALQKN